MYGKLFGFTSGYCSHEGFTKLGSILLQLNFRRILLAALPYDCGQSSAPGGPRGRVVKSADISLLHHLTAVSCVGSSPASQVLLAGVSGVFSRGSPVFAPPTDWPFSL